MPLLLDLKIGADHVLRLDIVLYRRICDDRAGGSALGAADDPDLKSVFIEIFHKLHHRQIEIVDISHIVEAGGLFLPELHNVVVEFLHRHAGVSLGKVSCQRFVREVSGFDRRGDFLEFV